MDISKDEILSDMERDVIGEVMNISLGSSATSLSSLLNQRVDITVPEVKVVSALEFSFDDLEPAVGVEIKYLSGIEGNNIMILKKADIKVILETLMGTTIEEENFEFDEIAMSAVCEVMNQMMGSAATALADFLGKRVEISTPVTYEIKNQDDFKNRYFEETQNIVAVKFNLNVGQMINSEFINVISVPLAKEMVSLFLSGTGLSDSSDDVVENKSSSTEKEDTLKVNDEPVSYSTDVDDESEKSKKRKAKKIKEIKEIEDVDESYEDDNYEEDEDEEYDYYEEPRASRKRRPKSKKHRAPVEPVNVSPVEYESFDNEEEEILSDDQLTNLGLIMSVPLQISVEIGRTKKKIKEILEFQQGTIVELNKQAGAQVDIIVNGQVIAKGDVVVINDNFGVRVTEIVKKDEIVKLTK